MKCSLHTGIWNVLLGKLVVLQVKYWRVLMNIYNVKNTLMVPELEVQEVQKVTNNFCLKTAYSLSSKVSVMRLCWNCSRFTPQHSVQHYFCLDSSAVIPLCVPLCSHAFLLVQSLNSHHYSPAVPLCNIWPLLLHTCFVVNAASGIEDYTYI